MSIISTHRAFTLIELIIVIAIMGIIATLVSSRLTTLNDQSTVLTPATLKHYLSAFNSDKRLDLFCYDECSQCDLWEENKKIRTGIELEHPATLGVRRFNHFGRLIPADPAIRLDDNERRAGCFEFSLYADGITSSLILESEDRFIAYTPLSDSAISGTEEQLRTMMYDRTLMNTGSHYGSR